MTTETPGEVTVRTMWEHQHERRWAEAAALLSEDAVVRYPDSGRELRGRTEFAAFNRDYPGRSLCTVLRTLSRPEGEGELVVGEVRVDNDERGQYFCAGFYLVADGRITGADEYWVGPPDEQ